MLEKIGRGGKVTIQRTRSTSACADIDPVLLSPNLINHFLVFLPPFVIPVNTIFWLPYAYYLWVPPNSNVVYTMLWLLSHSKYRSYTYFQFFLMLFLSAKLVRFFRMSKKKYFINFVVCTTQHFLHLCNRAMLHCDMEQFMLHICKYAYFQEVINLSTTM